MIDEKQSNLIAELKSEVRLLIIENAELKDKIRILESDKYRPANSFRKDIIKK